MAVPSAEEVLLSKTAEIVQGINFQVQQVPRQVSTHYWTPLTLFKAPCICLPRITPCHLPWINRTLYAWLERYLLSIHVYTESYIIILYYPFILSYTQRNTQIMPNVPLPDMTSWGNRVCVRKINVLNNLAQLPFHIYPHSMCLRWSQHPSLLVIKTVEDLTNSFHLTFHICKAKTLYATDQCTTTLNTFNLAGSHLRLAVPSKFSCGPNAILP